MRNLTYIAFKVTVGIKTGIIHVQQFGMNTSYKIVWFRMDHYLFYLITNVNIIILRR